MGLIIAGLSMLSVFIAKRDEKKTVLVTFLVGAASFGTAMLGALPPDDGVTQDGESIVINIDRTNDYHDGAPGNLFVDARHMIRKEGTIELHEGANLLSFFSLKPPPNIDAVRLAKL